MNSLLHCMYCKRNDVHVCKYCGALLCTNLHFYFLPYTRGKAKHPNCTKNTTDSDGTYCIHAHLIKKSQIEIKLFYFSYITCKFYMDNYVVNSTCTCVMMTLTKKKLFTLSTCTRGTVCTYIPMRHSIIGPVDKLKISANYSFCRIASL